MDESLVVRLRTPPADEGPPFRFGSGYLIGSGRILTAGHTLRPPGDDTHVPVTGDLCQVLPWGGDPQVGWLAGQVEHCEVELDLAIVSVPGLARGAKPVRWGRLDGSDPVPWKAIGFPVAGLDDSGRQPETVWGEVSPTTESFADLLGLAIDSRVARPTPAGTSGWAGLSGAAVFSHDRLVGVVIEDPQEFAGSLTARRIDCLADRPLLYEAAGSPVIEAVSAESADDSEWISRHAEAMKREFLTRPPDEYFVDVPPLRSGGLVGRDDLMTRAVDLLIRGEDVAFVGLGGAGKSALASALVRDDTVRARFRAGIFWLSVGRTKDGPPAWRLKLTNWARELHKPNDRIMEASRMGVESLVDLVNEGFGAARMLLIFDDVWENSEALLFKRLGPECRRVLTTRVNSVANVVSTHGVLPVDDLPDSEEARELFDRLAPAVVQQRPDTASVAIPVIGRLPLVLVIAASYLQARVIDDPTCLDEALADVLDVNQRLKLAPEMPDLITTDSLRETAATLEAVIDLSAGSLSIEDRRALTSLAAFPPKMNSFSWDAARAVAASREAVVTLRRYSLVEDLVEDLPAFRLTMHQTIHDYAVHETADDPDACRRMAEYFLAFISKQQENATHAETWLAALEQEKDNIRAALEWAIAREETLLAYRLMSELWDYWYRRSHYAIATELADRILALHLTDTESSQLLRAKLLNDTGNFAYNMADLKQAEQRHSAALAIRQKFADDSIAGSWNNLALVYRERGDYVMADRFFNQALDRNKTAENKYWEAMNLDNIGINARFRHDLEASEKILRGGRCDLCQFEGCMGPGDGTN